MSLKPLTLDTVEAGNLVAAVNKALEIIGRDSLERYSIQKARSVHVKITLNPGAPIDNRNGPPRLMPLIDWEVRYAVPGAAGMTTRAFVENRHGALALMVNTNDPLGSDPNQGTIFDDLPAETEQIRKPYKE